MGCNSEYGWPWVYLVKFDGDTYVRKGDPTEAFYINTFIADALVAILISAFIICLFSLIINKLRKENG